MILIIDTSSSVAVLATIDGRASEMLIPSRSPDLVPVLRRLAHNDIAKVAVATGPGSFTGLRVGVAFALGLAMGRQIPIVPLATLDLQKARSDTPATAVVDAGRGRYYFQTPGGAPKLGAAAEIPASDALIGAVANRAPLVAAGHHFMPDRDLRPFVEAAAKLLEVAPEVPYRNLEITYMQSFSPKGA